MVNWIYRLSTILAGVVIGGILILEGYLALLVSLSQESRFPKWLVKLYYTYWKLTLNCTPKEYSSTCKEWKIAAVTRVVIGGLFLLISIILSIFITETKKRSEYLFITLFFLGVIGAIIIFSYIIFYKLKTKKKI